MKFIFEKNAPDIPLEILEAQENDNLVLFCGSGISYPAGLPLFKGLVDEVYKELTTEPSELEQQAKKQGRYDTALELLERRFYSDKRTDNFLVRKAIATRLKLNEDANLETHKAILELAKTKYQKYRLVTTNVDHGFKLADPVSFEMSDTAPKLPVPKAHKWQSIVYLHGIIDEKLDPNNEHLIFTSGDFGAAYLTERWASRFASELFRHFTVLFVGYSVDDPVMRYMTDAIAADRRRGYTDFKQPYALAGAKNEKLTKTKLDWDAKGIIPLPYEDVNDHEYLHKTLKEWAAYCRDGLNGVKRIKTHATQAPIQPYEHDDSVKWVIDNLKRTEYAAKIFCEMNEPPAPIEWLAVLEKEGLLAKLRTDQKDLLLQNSSNNNNLIPPHQTTKSLWSWLVEYHLESKQFVEWTIGKSANLHPDFIQLIKNKLNNQSQPLKKSYLTFWRIIVLNQKHCVFSDDFHELCDLELSRDSLNLLSLSKLFEPKIQFSKVFLYEDKNASKPYDAEVIIGIDSGDFEHITQYIDELTSMLLPITNSLKQAMEFWEILGQANNEFDLSHWHLVSISLHSQNQSHHSWCYLIEFCRDLWNATYKKDKSLALVILELWKTIPFPVFRRLVFHAYTIQDITTASEKLKYLLIDNAWWFWSVETTREKFRLLASLCPQLTTDELNRLEQTIITGAPRNKYRDDLSDKDFKNLNDSQIWLHLAKLETFGVSLSKPTEIFYKSLSKKYPELRLQEDNRDEFTRWHSSWIGNKCDLTADELIDLSVENRIEKLLEPSAEYSEGRIDLFKNICKDKPDIALETLSFLAAQSKWNASIWRAGLDGVSDADDPLWLEIAKLIVHLPNELIKEEAWVIAWWMKKTIDPIKADSNEEKCFWKIFDLLIINIKPITINSADIISQATNHPIGILTDVLINRIAIRGIKNKEKITDSKLLYCLDKLLDSKNKVFSLARVILLSRLNYFHAIDPEWTQTNLLPLLDWDLSNETAIYWQGYLWNPKISADLALDLKHYLLTTLREHSNELGKTNAQIFQLFTLICLEYQSFYDDKEQKEVLDSIDKEGLIEIVKFIYHSFGDDKENNDKYWKSRIEPFFKTAWPKQAESLDPKVSEYFVLMCIKLDIEFESAVNSINRVLTSFNCSRLFLKQLQDSQYITKHPLSTFELLKNVRVERWDFKDYQEIMRSLAEHAPSLRQNSEFQKIEQFLIREIGNT